MVITSGLFFYAGQYFIDKQRRFVFIYFLGGLSFIVCIAFFVIILGLALYALRIFWKLNKHSTTEEKALRLFKERVSFKNSHFKKFTVFVMIISPFGFSICIILFIFSIQAIIGKDIFSIQFYMLQSSIVTLIFQFGTLL
jgi:hypothetical protein